MPHPIPKPTHHVPVRHTRGGQLGETRQQTFVGDEAGE
jgi:hypothetical protein